MIEMQFLAAAFNKMLGTDDFAVWLHTNINPDRDGDKTTCTLLVQREPFALGNIDAESVRVTLTFDMKIQPDTDVAAARLARIKDILGWQSFQVQTPNGTYNADSFLEMQQPGFPRIDTGCKIQQFVVSGTALIASSTLGAVVCNRIKTYINDAEVLVVSAQPSLSKGADEVFDLAGTNTMTDTQEISRANTATYTLLYRGSEIDNTLMKLIEGGESDALNTTFSLRRVYPGFEVTHTVKLDSGVITHQAGAFLMYQVNFKKQKAAAEPDTSEVQ